MNCTFSRLSLERGFLVQLGSAHLQKHPFAVCCLRPPWVLKTRLHIALRQANLTWRPLLSTLILRPLAFRGGLGVRSLPGSSLAVDSSLVSSEEGARSTLNICHLVESLLGDNMQFYTLDIKCYLRLRVEDVPNHLDRDATCPPSTRTETLCC